MKKPKSKSTPSRKKPPRSEEPVRRVKAEVLDSPEDEADEDFDEAIEAEVINDASAADGVLTVSPSGEVLKVEPAEKLTALSPTDPLKRYLSEIQRYDLLDPEEELREVRKLREKGDVSAAKRLVQANLRLVVKIALEYRNVYTNLLDLIQEGNVGLMKAVSKFDPSKGARLGYYSSWWIRSYILKYLLDNFRLVRVGTTQAQKKLFYQLMKEKQRLETQGFAPSPKLLADRLQVREKDVVEMDQRLSSSGAELSLDLPVGDPHGDGRTRNLGDTLEDPRGNVDDAISQNELIEKLRERLPEFEKSLNLKEKQVLKERLLSEDPKTLQEVADQYGLTRERVRQIESKVIERLREFLKDWF